MKIKYREGNPTINIRVKGPEGKAEYKAYLDTGAGRTLIPERDAVKLGLEYVGATEIITGSGKDYIKLYRATITFLNKEFSVLVLGKDLPEQAVVKDSWKRHPRRIQSMLRRHQERDRNNLTRLVSAARPLEENQYDKRTLHEKRILVNNTQDLRGLA